MTRPIGLGGLADVLQVVRQTLSNGLRVIVLELPQLHSVACALLVRAGPRYESRATNGLTHLVEHLLFRGTRNRPSSVVLNSAIEALGGEVNGTTQRDAMTVHLTVPPVAVEPGLRILGEICTTPLLDGLEVEKQVVVEEILDTVDASGFENDLDTLSRRVLWAGHPMGMPVAGTVDSVKRFTKKQCQDHFRRVFVAENAVLCVAGPVDAAHVHAVVAEAFAQMRRGRPLAEPHCPAPVQGLPIQVRETDDSQVSLMLTFPAPHEHDPRFAALLLLRRVLDDGLSSRLRQAVCEQRGLAYSVAASIDLYGDAGAIDLEASCAPKKLVVTAAQMLSTLKGLIEGGVTHEELERAKTRHRAELEFCLDDPEELCAWYGASELLACSASYEGRLEEALRVDLSAINRLATEVFEPSRALLTVVGPAHPTAVGKLERLLGRPAGSSLWLNSQEAKDDDATHEIEPFEMLALSEWAAKPPAPIVERREDAAAPLAAVDLRAAS